MGIVSKIILESNAASEYLLSDVHVILTMMLVLKFYNIKILEIYHNNVLSYILEHRCRMFAEQLKIISWTLAYMFMSSYFLNLSVKEKICIWKFVSEHKVQIKAKGWFLKSTREDTLKLWPELLASVGNEFILRNLTILRCFKISLKCIS